MRNHKYHVDSDYKNPPADSEWRRAFHAHNAQRLKQPPVHLNSIEVRRAACTAFVKRFEYDHVECAAIAVAEMHYHSVIQVPDPRPGTWLGRAKKYAAHALKRDGVVEGRVWARSAQLKPIVDATHSWQAIRYVMAHANGEGASVWVNERFVE